ncbi:MAG TPA: hypothetical protein VNV88_10255 [Candidatus Solibacter sp.]|nr:hypothetical protein [Candidatus Solibacter sp.]
MKTRLLKLVLACTAFSCLTARSFPQAPSLSPTLTTATCGLAICAWNAFGPKTYTRPVEQPRDDRRHEEDGDDDRSSLFSDSFTVQNVATQYKLHITAEERTRAEVFLNGQKIVAEDDFEDRHQREDRAECHEGDEQKCISGSKRKEPEIVTIEKTIHLASANLLEVRLHGKPGKQVTLSVVGVDSDFPSIVETLSPSPNSFGWNNTNVGVIFGCDDGTSGIASCPSTFFLTAEGLNQIAGGTAFDRAGNSATATIQISIDKTPPTIAASQSPAPNAAGWNNSTVTVSFSCADALSGVALCPSPIAVSSEGANQPVSGIALDRAGNSASVATSVNIDETPPLLSISSPANGSSASVATLQLAGSVSDNLSGIAFVTCNGSPATLTTGSFACNVTLVAGINSIRVQATDVAGNIANTQLSVTFNAIPVVPPKAIFITPVLATLTIGQTRGVSLVGDAGQPVTQAIWTSSDPTVVSITSSDPPQLTALAQGTATLTASFNSLTTTMTVNVLAATIVPFGTPLWSVNSITGNRIHQMLHGNPVNSGDPDVYVIDGPNMVRALTADGEQLWAAQVTAPPPAAALQLAREVLPAGPAMSAAPSQIASNGIDSWRAKRREAGMLNPWQQRLAARQQQITRLLATPGTSQRGGMTGAAITAPSTPAATLPADLSGFTFIDETVPDNSGGIIQLLTTCLDSDCFSRKSSFSRIDNTIQQQVWISGLNDGVNESLNGPIAVAEDDTVYGSVVFGPQNADGSQTNSAIIAVDGATGHPQFTVPIPASHFHFTLNDSSGTVLQDNSEDQAAEIGAIVVMPDGSLQALVSTAHITEVDTKGGFGSPCGLLASSCVTSLSDHESLKLLVVQPGGSFSMQAVQEFDFDATGCVPPSFTSLSLNPCEEPMGHIQAYIPQEVIPDGLGGTLAEYTVESQDRNVPSQTKSQSFVRHTNSSGGTQDYDMGSFLVPFFANNTFESAQSLVLGANNVAYGTGLATVAFDVTSGAKLWSTPFLHPTGLVAATSDGRLIATELTNRLKQAGSASALKIYDSQGVLTALPFNPAAASIAYFDANSFLLIRGGKGESMSWPAPVPIDEENPYNLPGGNPPAQRARTPPKITGLSPSRGLIGSTIEVELQGIQLRKVVSIDAGSGITATIDPSKVSDTSLGTTFVIDPAAGAGVHKITATLKNGEKLQSKQDFFVQIPRSFVPSGATPQLSGSVCPVGTLGTGFIVHYQVSDQNGDPVAVGGMTPLETIPQQDIQRQPFSTPKSTNPDGTFDDDPVAFCVGPPLPRPGLQACTSWTQSFEILLSGTVYPINTNTAVRGCIQGMTIQVLGDSQNATFSIGTVN